MWPWSTISWLYNPGKTLPFVHRFLSSSLASFCAIAPPWTLGSSLTGLSSSSGIVFQLRTFPLTTVPMADSSGSKLKFHSLRLSLNHRKNMSPPLIFYPLNVQHSLIVTYNYLLTVFWLDSHKTVNSKGKEALLTPLNIELSACYSVSARKIVAELVNKFVE